MKTMSATNASKEFGRYLDMVQREPVIVTKQNRPVAVTMSIQDAEELLEYRIQAGISKGLQDVRAGRTIEATPQNIVLLKERIKAQVSVETP